MCVALSWSNTGSFFDEKAGDFESMLILWNLRLLWSFFLNKTWNYARIKKYDIANGPGMRASLYVSGCTHG